MARKLADPPVAIVKDVLYPGEIFIVAGAPSVGKTRFQLHLLNGLATGGEGWWGQQNPMRVLYCSQRSWVVTSAQMRTVGITELPDNFQVFCPPDLTKFEKSEFNTNPLKYLENHVIDKNDPPRVAVLDTLATYLPHTKDFNFNSYSDFTRACDDVYYWGQQWQIAIPLSHHTAKQKSDSKHETATERILGSQAIMAVAIGSCILEHYTPDDPTYVRAYFMSHLGSPRSPRYFLGDDYSEVTLEEVSAAASASPIEKDDKLGEAEQKILAEVSTSPTDYKDVWLICNDKFGIAKNQLYATLDRLIKKRRLIATINGDSRVKQVYRPQIVGKIE
jgi:hypothetical protein